ncbi:MAG: leucine-rich repeat domain-containing protein [Cytophagales bacterium]
MKKIFQIISTLLFSHLLFAQPEANKYYESGLKNLKSNDFIKAIGDFTSAISMNEKHAEAYYQRAIAKDMMGKKMGFDNTELCYDLISAMKLGHSAAANMLLKSSCLSQCYNLQLAVVEPDIVFCADFNSKVLSTLPTEVGKMEFLVKLSLFNNKFTKFPDMLGKCTSLIQLDFSSNKLTELNGSTLKNLVFLQELNLAKNDIPALPKEIGELKKMKMLNLRGNALKVLPNTIGQLQELEVLDLSINEISVLPTEILNLKKLKSLYLTGNKIPKKDIKDLQTKMTWCKVYYDE